MLDSYKIKPPNDSIGERLKNVFAPVGIALVVLTFFVAIVAFWPLFVLIYILTGRDVVGEFWEKTYK